MTNTTSDKKISASSQHVIDRTVEEFSDVVKLGVDLLNSPRGRGEPAFTRGDFTAALAGDQEIIESMRFHAVRKGWIKKDDRHSIPRVLEWIKLTRTVTTNRR